jgi:hypothetical protein
MRLPPNEDGPAAPGEEAGRPNAQEAGMHHPRDGRAADLHQTEYDDGSSNEDDPDRPKWVSGVTQLEKEFEYQDEAGTYAFSVFKGRNPDKSKCFLTGRRVQGGWSEIDNARRNDPRAFYSHPGLEHVLIGAGDRAPVLYRLPELLAAMEARPDDPVFVCEGEKDVDTLSALGLIATTNPNGATSWRSGANHLFHNRQVVILTDNDRKGRERAASIRPGLKTYAQSVKVVELPDLRPNGDVTDWLNSGHTKDDLLKVVEATDERSVPTRPGGGVELDDFHAYMPMHNYIFAPSGETWPASSVNSRIPPVPLVRNGEPVLDDDGEQVMLKANVWLDQHSAVEQMTWAPGEPQVIAGRLIAEGGWIQRPGCNVFNLYRPPSELRGDPSKAQPWIDHVQRVYPGEAEHIINWLAHRVQRPQEKINHALVLGGPMGVGKDTILEPAKAAVGPWNFTEVSPQHMLGRFNGFVKSVILRVSEARDLGDVDRFAFYDHMKAYTAAPPDVLRVDEKHLREHAVFNVCGVIITTNHKTNGIFLPADDRRHYVAWTELVKEDFTEAYWDRLWGWYERGGIGHVAAFLGQRDISSFRAKMPPPKTQAFWDIVASNSAPEDAELTDAIEKLGNPDALTLNAIALVSEQPFAEWLRDRKNFRSVPHKMEECGYKPVRNAAAKSGRWKVDGKDAVIYARKELSIREAITAAEKRAREGNNVAL